MNEEKMRREELEGTRARARAPEAGFKMDGAGARACACASHLICSAILCEAMRL